MGHVLGEVGGRGGKRKFPKTPKLRGAVRDSCRVFGSLEGNKVQGDFHITARGHGYMEFGEHLDHSGTFAALSSGPYPSNLFLNHEACLHHSYVLAQGSIKPALPRVSSQLFDASIVYADTIACLCSFQLLSHHQRALLRTLLSHPPQPPRPDTGHNCLALLQISILPFRGTDHLYPQSGQLSRPRILRYHLHQSVRRNFAISFGWRAADPRHLLQVRYRAHPADDQRRKRESVGIGGEGGKCGEWSAGRRRVVLSIDAVGG